MPYRNNVFPWSETDRAPSNPNENSRSWTMRKIDEPRFPWTVRAENEATSRWIIGPYKYLPPFNFGGRSLVSTGVCWYPIVSAGLYLLDAALGIPPGKSQGFALSRFPWVPFVARHDRNVCFAFGTNHLRETLHLISSTVPTSDSWNTGGINFR